MYDMTFSEEVQASEAPACPTRPSRHPGAGYKWLLVSSCWQVTRSQTIQIHPHDVAQIVSHGRWVWTWETRPVL